jgi:hypothetical protein
MHTCSVAYRNDVTSTVTLTLGYKVKYLIFIVQFSYFVHLHVCSKCTNA